MIIDPADELWEISKNLGTMYVATSRGKTLGSKDQAYLSDSAMCHILDGKQHFNEPIKKLQEKAKWPVLRIVQEASKLGEILGGEGRRVKDEV